MNSRKLDLIRKIVERHLPPSDLRTWLWLSCVPAGQRVFIAQIALALGLSESSIHGALGRLRASGMVESGGRATGKVYRVVRDPDLWKSETDSQSVKSAGAAAGAGEKS